MESLEMTDRIRRLRDRIPAGPKQTSIEQARITTRIYREEEKSATSPILVRAKALRAALSEIEIQITPGELIVGSCMTGIRPDLESDRPASSPGDMLQIKEEELRELQEDILPYWKGKSLKDVLRSRYGEEIDHISKIVTINQMDHPQGSICPNCAKWLALGPAGLRREAKAHFAYVQEIHLQEFYRSVEIVMEGAQTFMLRYAKLAWEMSRSDSLNADQKRELLQVAANCEALSMRPPANFYEAVQSLWFLFVILQLESGAAFFSLGRLDVFLRPYYEEDLSWDRINQQQALEILECLWLRFHQTAGEQTRNSAECSSASPTGFYITIGGQDAHGEDFVNELSYLCLLAQSQLSLSQPILSVRLHEKTGHGLLRKAARVVEKGGSIPQFFSDKAILPALRELGISGRDACSYAVVGNADFSIPGSTLGWSNAARFHMDKALELTLNGGRSLRDEERLAPDYGCLTDYETYPELEAAFRHHLDNFMTQTVNACEQVEQIYSELLPVPFLSAVMDDCLIRGMDVMQGGAKYNLSGIQIHQITELAASLAVIKKLVFEERTATREEILQELRNNTGENASLQDKLRNRIPETGIDADQIDAIGTKWEKYVRARLSTYTNHRGGIYHTGMYSIPAHIPVGGDAGASPEDLESGRILDARRQNEHISRIRSADV